jgi:hypothetical protein
MLQRPPGGDTHTRHDRPGGAGLAAAFVAPPPAPPPPFPPRPHPAALKARRGLSFAEATAALESMLAFCGSAQWPELAFVEHFIAEGVFPESHGIGWIAALGGVSQLPLLHLLARGGDSTGRPGDRDGAWTVCDLVAARAGAAPSHRALTCASLASALHLHTDLAARWLLTAHTESRRHEVAARALHARSLRPASVPSAAAARAGPGDSASAVDVLGLVESRAPCLPGLLACSAAVWTYQHPAHARARLCFLGLSTYVPMRRRADA